MDVKNKRMKSGRDKPAPKKYCNEEIVQTDSDDESRLLDTIDVENELKFLPVYLKMEESIRPQLKEIDKFIDIHLWKQEHEFDSTFSGKLVQMEREIEVFKKSDEDLKNMLRGMLELSQEEALSIKNALNAINDIRKKRCLKLSGREIGTHLKLNEYVRDIGRSIPMWMGLSNEIAPPLCGAIPPPDDYEFKVGQLVAAHVVMDDYEQEVHAELGIIGKWILSVVTEVNKELYTIKDMDGSETTYSVHKKKLIALPLYMADPETNPEAIYPENSLVLALYIGTTCFFPGIVTISPKSKEEDYKIMFRDTSSGDGWGIEIEVEQQFIVPYKDLYSIVDEEEREQLINRYGQDAIMPIKKSTL